MFRSILVPSFRITLFLIVPHIKTQIFGSKETCELYLQISIDLYSIPIYLDLPFGTYFFRCSKTLELSLFLRKNAVPENKCRCEKLSAHVVGYFLRLVGYFCRLVGHFRHWKRVWHQYIRRNSGLPQKVVLMQNLLIGQKAEMKHLLKRQIYVPIPFHRPFSW